MSAPAFIPERRRERLETHAGFQFRVVSYKLGDVFYATADNVSPGANIARAEAATQEEAEKAVVAKARERLAGTRTFPVS